MTFLVFSEKCSKKRRDDEERERGPKSREDKKVRQGGSRERRGEQGNCSTDSAHGANQDRAHRMVPSARDITFSVNEGIQNRPNRK